MGVVALMLVAAVGNVASKSFYYVAERLELEPTYSVGVPPVAAISEVMGPAGLGLMVVAVSAGVLTGLNGFFTAASRVLFTLGRANLVSSRLGELNGKEHTPRNAILLVCGVPGDPVVWARIFDVGRRHVQCRHHGGVLLYLLLRMEDRAHWAGPRDAQAHCAEQVL